MNENNTPLVLPEELKDKPWVSSILDESGHVDPNKVFKKLDGQESLLGKKVLPGKDASDEDWKKFAEDITKDYQDSDYDVVLSGFENKSELIAKYKAAGMTPRQAQIAAETALKEREAATAKKYDADTFQAEILKALPDEKERAKAKSVLQKAGLWEKTQNAANEEALGIIVAAAKIGVAYDVDDVPGKDGGSPVTVQGNGKGVCQEYADRIVALESGGMSHADALKQAKAEFSVVDD